MKTNPAISARRFALLLVFAIVAVPSASAASVPTPGSPDARPLRVAEAPKTLPLPPPRQMEKLGRGVVVLNQGEGKIWISWRLLVTDPANVAFNIYRQRGTGEAVKVNPAPISKVTFFQDNMPSTSEALTYTVRPVVNGKEGKDSNPFLNKLPANAPARPYIDVPMQTPPNYTINDCSVGDLDGDGEYEIIVHMAGRSQDNSQKGITDEPILQAYKMDGTLLWTINLGKNIREGAHYTQFMVYDLDGDGRAELVCKTAPGSVDGTGHKIQLHGDNTEADYRNENGYILEGPEYLTVFDGLTGKELATTDYVPKRGSVASWGDDYGNRVDRFLACIAYLDGVHPSVVMCRGYYTHTYLVAWDWRDGQLTKRWVFDSDNYGSPNDTNPYRGQGNHGLSVADVDGDGKDEIIYGAMAINHDGKPLYTTKLGHGDAMHVSDLDPTRPGLEVFDIHEHPKHAFGMEFRDAKTGKMIWGKPGGSKPSPDVGRGVAYDIDPRYVGAEIWASGDGLDSLFDTKGKEIGPKPKSCNFAVLWDGDTLYELLDSNHIDKWDYVNGKEVPLLTAKECESNNGTKSDPCLSGDIFGDWREEVMWRTKDNTAIHIYTTTIPTDWRTYTLMQDPQYRLSIAWQNVSYNQPPHTGFFFGANMPTPPRPNTVVIEPKPAAK